MKTRLQVKVLSVERLLTLNKVLCVPSPQGIGLSVVVGWEGVGILWGGFLSLGETCIRNFSLLLCLEPCKKFLVVVGGER